METLTQTICKWGRQRAQLFLPIDRVVQFRNRPDEHLAIRTRRHDLQKTKNHLLLVFIIIIHHFCLRSAHFQRPGVPQYLMVE